MVHRGPFQPLPYYDSVILCFLHLIINNTIGHDSVRTLEKTTMLPNKDMLLIGLKSHRAVVGYPIFYMLNN